MCFITAIGTAVPPNKVAQHDIARFMQKVMQPGYEQSRKINTVFRSSGISFRHSVLTDYNKTSAFEYYPNGQEQPQPDTKSRMEKYRSHALELSVKAVDDCLVSKEIKSNEITHLITVSCTGMYNPGLDIELVSALKLNASVQRTAVNFMGCYAAINALRVAKAFCESTKARVLIVCTELCSLHFQNEPTDDNILSNALFADGAAAMLVESEPRSGWNLVPALFHNDLTFSDDSYMAWSIGNSGFEMKLSTLVPDVIKGNIGGLTREMLQKVGMQKEHISYFAIHPGGKKILEVIEEELGVDRNRIEHSYYVLSNYGNMSSPTIVFVLKEILKSISEKDDGKSILSFAFGPGLTLESVLLTIQRM